MNTWRDIKAAPVLESILATDGNHVYCGYIDNKAGKDVFIGYDLQEMEMEELFLSAIKGWQPVPDTWKPEKTADEMFRDLGYERDFPNEEPGSVLYVKKLRKMKCEIWLWNDDPEDKFVEAFLKDGEERYDRNMSFKETVACAQKIREMEAEHETD